MITVYENLANAIIELAAKDYINALEVLEYYPEDVDANNTRSEVERFFRSGWFEMLTNLDGKTLLSALKIKCRKARKCM